MPATLGPMIGTPGSRAEDPAVAGLLKEIRGRFHEGMDTSAEVSILSDRLTELDRWNWGSLMALQQHAALRRVEPSAERLIYAEWAGRGGSLNEAQLIGLHLEIVQTYRRLRVERDRERMVAMRGAIRDGVRDCFHLLTRTNTVRDHRKPFGIWSAIDPTSCVYRISAYATSVGAMIDVNPIQREALSKFGPVVGLRADMRLDMPCVWEMELEMGLPGSLTMPVLDWALLGKDIVKTCPISEVQVTRDDGTKELEDYSPGDWHGWARHLYGALGGCLSSDAASILTGLGGYLAAHTDLMRKYGRNEATRPARKQWLNEACLEFMLVESGVLGWRESPTYNRITDHANGIPV